MGRSIKRLAGPSAGTEAEVTAYTVPSGTMTQIMQVRFTRAPGSAGSHAGQYAVGIGGLAVGQLIGGSASTSDIIPLGGAVDVDGPVGFPMTAGEQLHILAGADVTWTVNGIENTL